MQFQNSQTVCGLENVDNFFRYGLDAYIQSHINGYEKLKDSI